MLPRAHCTRSVHWRSSKGRAKPVSFQDKTLTCKDCGQEFIWTAGEQEFYASRGLQNAPTRCPADRAARRAQGGGRGGGGGGGGYSSGGYGGGGRGGGGDGGAA